jgi:hypothetical protein
MKYLKTNSNRSSAVFKSTSIQTDNGKQEKYVGIVGEAIERRVGEDQMSAGGQFMK